MHYFPVLLVLLIQPAPEVKLATLEGKVSHAGTQTPLRKAKVSLTLAGTDTVAVSAETTDDGKYVLKDVKPGRYRLAAERTGYQQTSYGARKAGQSLGQLIRVDAGAALTGLDIALAFREARLPRCRTTWVSTALPGEDDPNKAASRVAPRVCSECRQTDKDRPFALLMHG